MPGTFESILPRAQKEMEEWKWKQQNYKKKKK